MRGHGGPAPLGSVVWTAGFTSPGANCCPALCSQKHQTTSSWPASGRGSREGALPAMTFLEMVFLHLGLHASVLGAVAVGSFR